MPTVKETGQILEGTIAESTKLLSTELNGVKISELPPKVQMYVAAEIIGIIRDANEKWRIFKESIPELNKKPDGK